jgi:hypothetical protein
LALNEKSTQPQAAEKSGLSIGQVRYWVAEFRKKRLGIFHEILLEEPNEKPKMEKDDSVKVDSDEITKKLELAEDKPKATKDIKGKKSKKKAKKKEKKDKKNKKGKKKKKSKK